MIARVLQGSRLVYLSSRLLSALLWACGRLDDALCESWAVRLLGLSGPLRRWRRGTPRPLPGRGADRSGWAEGSLLFSAARRAAEGLWAGSVRLAREGFLGRWWKTVARARAAAPQRTWAAIVLSALGADLALLLASGESANAEGLAVRGVLLAGGLAAARLEEGRFALWWRSWWLGGLTGAAAESPGRSGGSGERFSFGPVVAAGALLGVGWRLSPGVAFLGVVAAWLAAGLRRAAAPEERSFLLRLFSLSLALRAALVAAVYVWAVSRGRFYPHPNVLDFHLWVPMVFGDGGYFTSRAWALSQVWRGAEVWPHALYEVRQPYGATAFLYIPAAFFYLFGADGLVAVRFINVLIGACLPLLVYGMARDLFGPSAARAASAAAAVFPSLLLWSLDLLKDSLFIALALAALWLTLRFQRRRRVGYLLAAAAAAGLSAAVREVLGNLALGAVALGLVPFAWRWWVGRSPVRASLALLLLAGVLLSPPARDLLGSRLYSVFSIQRGAAETAGRSTYTLWDRRLYRHREPGGFLEDVRPADVARAFLLGQYHFWLEPTPWAERSPVERLAVFQMIFWYLILGAGLAGMWRLRGRPADLFVLLAFVSVVSVTIGMTGGNVGTVFRHRDSLTPVLIVLAGGGLAGLLGRSLRPGGSLPSGSSDGGAPAGPEARG